MNKSYFRFAPTAFAIALFGLGVQHFLFGEFITGRALAWPEGFPGKAIFAYATGLLFVLTSIALVSGKKATSFLVASGFTILIWAGLRNIVEVLINLEYGGLLTNTMKALTLGSGAFVVASTLPQDNSNFATRILPRLASAGVSFLGLFLVVGGIQHFLFAEFVKTLVPSWIPGQLFWTYFAAVALILAGISLITRIKIQLASLLGGIMVGLWLIVLHIPRAVAMWNQNEWTAVFEAFAVSCLLFTIHYKEIERSVLTPATAMRQQQAAK